MFREYRNKFIRCTQNKLLQTTVNIHKTHTKQTATLNIDQAYPANNNARSPNNIKFKNLT